MAVVLGRSAVVRIGASPSVVGKLVGSLDYEVTDTAIDITSHDSTAQEVKALGVKRGSGTINAFFDSADAGQDAIRTAIGATAGVALEIYPEGNTTGKMKLSGTVVLTSVKMVEADMEGATKFSASFTGYLAEGTAT